MRRTTRIAPADTSGRHAVTSATAADATRFNTQRCGRSFLRIALASFAVASAGADPPDTGSLRELEKSFTALIDTVSPSVVGIRAYRHIPRRAFEGGATAEQKVVVNGSGTVIDADGSILTNQHVIGSADEIEVRFSDGRSLSAVVIAADERSDLAIIRTSRANARPARFADYSKVKRGQWSLALGNPFGLGADGQLSASVGVISNLDRRLPGLGEADDRQYSNMIQTTASIHPGNSGGPLLNLSGELVGVITAMHTRSATDEGVGFAIPITPEKRGLIERLCKGENVDYGYLGVVVRAPTAGESTEVGADGALVERIEPGGPAQVAGFEEDDVIVRFGGRPVPNPAALADLAGAATIGSDVEVEVLRGGRKLSLTIRVARRGEKRSAQAPGGAILWRGVRLVDHADGVAVIAFGDADRAGHTRLHRGDVIEAVDGNRVRSVVEFRDEVRGKQGEVQLAVRQRGNLTIKP